MKKIKILTWLLLVCIGTFIGACSINSKLSSSTVESLSKSAHYKQGKFRNTAEKDTRSFSTTMLRIIKRSIFEESIDNFPNKLLPVKVVTRSQLDTLSNDELYLIKLGHSSILLKVYGKYWLIDPMFSERASPFQFAGPKRFHPVPLSIEELPPIDKVLISHNHYDHLDKATIQKLISKTQEFLVPLGNDVELKRWGVDSSKIKVFNWWQEYKTIDALFVFTPTQHFSGRSLSDRNNTLWGSWVIKTAKDSLYFSGDSGYFSGFKEIGDKYGPFDLTMIETGAYNNKDWPDVHMTPEDSVKAHIELRGKAMLPIHNSTFDLSFHPWYEPLERVSVEAQKRQVNLKTPIVGEVFTTKQKTKVNQWWKEWLPK